MKKITLVIAAAAALMSASCNKPEENKQVLGALSFSDFVVECDDAIETKALTPAGGSYAIFVYNSEGDVVASTNYSAVKLNDSKLPLPAGTYTLEARSTEESVPTAAFEQPVYGARKTFTVVAGETTTLGSLTCTLQQVKVTVSYSDDFLKLVTGPGSATVEVTSGYPLAYDMNYENGSASYEQSAGYFAVNNGDNTTMVVTFKGNYDGKSGAKMTKSFSGIAAKQWRQVKFIKKVDQQGTATFDIVINDLVDDAVLGSDITGTVDIIGEDPTAPKGDGGITLDFDYENGCDADYTDFSYLLMPQQSEKTIHLVLKSSVPNGVKKFWVDIASTNESFVSAVEAADAIKLDLVNPTEDNMIIFDVVPFPHGADLVGQTSLSFDLSKAQEAITIYPGTHTFTMNVVDQQGCKNTFPVTMVVL